MELGDLGGRTGLLALFCGRLKRLQAASGISQASLAAAAHLGRSQMSDMLNGKIKRLPDWNVTTAMVRACLEYAEATGRPVPPDLRDQEDWRRRYGDLEHDLDTEARSRPRSVVLPGWLLADVTDPFALEVHRPVLPDGPQRDLPALPAYVTREHDAELERVVAAAAQGASAMVVLVGGSSTGKTRACWEALRLLRKQPERWRLWHPIDPTRPEAALRELPSIGPRTVIWLNEAQLYLDIVAGGLGERIAAGLRELLRDPARAPVLVLATLWPTYWDVLSARSAAGADPHAQARELLTGRDITVPAAFTAHQLRLLPDAGDPRLAQAAEAAEEGQVIQFLAGAPELMARYRNAPPAAAALISAAIDARCLGMGMALPLAFLEAATAGYLSDTDWDGLSEDWLEQALTYTVTSCKGIRGPLTRMRPRPACSADPARGPAYRLADYLEQHGRHTRRQIPPEDFWKGAARFADPDDLPVLARAAEARGLLRDAARLRKQAAGQGNANEAAALVQNWYSLHLYSDDSRPAQWAADHAALDDPDAVIWLLQALREAGAEEQVAALLARDPAAHVSIDNRHAVIWLLDALRDAGAEEQVGVLAARAAAHVPLDEGWAVALLLETLQRAGAEEQVTALLAREPAAHARIDDQSAVAKLLVALRDTGTNEQLGKLADRAAAHVAIDDPDVVAWLLDALCKAGAEEQVAALLARDPAAHARIDDPNAVARLLKTLQKAGTKEQAAALLARNPAAHVAIDNRYAVAGLLETLQQMGAEEQVSVLAGRAAAHVAIDDHSAVAWLRETLRLAGAEEQLGVILAGDPAAHVAIDNPDAVARLLRALREAGAEGQVAALLARDPAAHVAIDDWHAIAQLLLALRDTGAKKQYGVLADRAAAHLPIGNPDAVAWLLGMLDRFAVQGTGAQEQLAALLARNPAAHVAIGDPYIINRLLMDLRLAGAQEQFGVLAGRAAAHVAIGDLMALTLLLWELRLAGAVEQFGVLVGRFAAHVAIDNWNEVAWLLDMCALPEARAEGPVAALLARDPAAHVAIDNPDAVARLLEALRKAGAEGQVAALLARDPAAHVAIDNSQAVTRLADVLQKVCAEERARSLIDRLPTEGRFADFCEQTHGQIRYRFGRELDGSPALSWYWDDLD